MNAYEDNQIYNLSNLGFPSSPSTCQFPCGCGSVVKNYIHTCAFEKKEEDKSTHSCEKSRSGAKLKFDAISMKHGRTFPLPSVTLLDNYAELCALSFAVEAEKAVSMSR